MPPSRLSDAPYRFHVGMSSLNWNKDLPKHRVADTILRVETPYPGRLSSIRVQVEQLHPPQMQLLESMALDKYRPSMSWRASSRGSNTRTSR